MRPQPLIAVKNVKASSRWYQRLLGCRSDHGGPEYERLVHNGTLILQLHAWTVEHHHGPIGDPRSKPYGNGVLLWFELDDFDAALARAAALRARILLPRHRNPPSGDGGPDHWECWLRDPDGYTVVLASPDGSANALPAGLGQPALRALKSIRVATLSQAARHSEAELLALHGFGPKAIRLLKTALAARGAAFASA